MSQFSKRPHTHESCAVCGALLLPSEAGSGYCEVHADVACRQESQWARQYGDELRAQLAGHCPSIELITCRRRTQRLCQAVAAIVCALWIAAAQAQAPARPVSYAPETAVYQAPVAAFQHAAIPAPLGIAITSERIELGRKLAFDPRLSADGRTSCMTCHDPEHGYATADPVALGSFRSRIVQVTRNGRTQQVTQQVRGVGDENAPTLLNSPVPRRDGRLPFMFSDARTIGLPDQSLLPLANRNEMGDQTERQVIDRLRGIPGYVNLFREAYGAGIRSQQNPGGSPVDRNRFGHAVSAFESQLLTDFNTPVHRRLAGDTTALSPEAEIGFGLFQKANCMSCHPAPYFTDRGLHNNGMEFVTRVAGETFDRGRAAIVANPRPEMERAFKTRPLVEIQRTNPYAHNGRMSDLERVARHYATGGRLADGRRDPNLDPRVAAIDLDVNQVQYLVAFLETAFASPTYPVIERPSLP